MSTAADLAKAVEQALGWVSRQPGVREAEVFAASTRSLLVRLNYTSHIPCNGVEEPKSTESEGLGLRVLFDGPDGSGRVGFGSEPGALDRAGAQRALDKARRAAVGDPDFRSLPRPSGERRTLVDYHDPALFAISDERLVETGWALVTGGLATFTASSRLARAGGGDEGLRRLGLVLGGDLGIRQERIAIASTRMPRAQTDESAVMTSLVTAMIEAHEAKGSGWAVSTRLDGWSAEAGESAAGRAIDAIGGARVPAGDYTVILGSQPVADILTNVLLPALQADAFHASSTPFLGRLGRPVAVPQLSLSDDGARPGFGGSRGITCEGLPTGRTDLIRDGVLVGLLSCWYDAERLLADPARRHKLGADGDAAVRALVPRNGFRARDGVRSFARPPSTSATNVVVEGAAPVPLEALIAGVREGLYVGRIWYTYPINGLRAGDFTCTVIGDSWLIRDGRLAVPIKANVLRIDDNVTRVLGSIRGIAREAPATVVWGSDEIVYAPALAVAGVHVHEIGDI